MSKVVNEIPFIPKVVAMSIALVGVFTAVVLNTAYREALFLMGVN